MAQHQVSAGVGPGFDPKSLSIKSGDCVRWTVVHGTHTITADDGSFDSGPLAVGESFDRDFPVAATCPYYCKYHGDPGGVGMSGVVVVE